MFPWDRGLFEDKVASFWCTTNTLIKWSQRFSRGQLKTACLVTTLLAISPSLGMLAMHPSVKCFGYTLFSCAISFFLFSYQGCLRSDSLQLVHEKTILFPLLPLVLSFTEQPEVALFFDFVASFSMIPLYVKDANLLPAVAYSLAFYFCLHRRASIPFTPWDRLNRWIVQVSTIVMGILCLYYAVPPPSRFPDLHSVLISAFSFSVFSLYYFLVLRLQYNELHLKQKEE